MNLQEAREKYVILKNYAHRQARYQLESDIGELLEILHASEEKAEVIEALQRKIETIQPFPGWDRAQFGEALFDFLGRKPSRPPDESV